MGFIEEQQLESAYVMGTYARKPVELVRGRGMRVEDAEGRTYLDFVSGVGAVSLGHCHPALVSAIEEQASTLVHVSNYYYIEHRGEVAHLVSDLLNECVDEAEREPWQSFFANSGAEANECAFKLARLHAKKRAMAAAEAAGADEDGVRAAAAAAPRLIVTLDASFHGRTLATLAATAQPAKQEAFQPLPDGFVRTPINDIKALESLFASQGDGICAVMVECVQGESGVHPCEPEFLAAVRRLTAERGALFMCDEIQCGMYRCGTYPFGFQHFGIAPDVVTIAKGIASGFPMGMCAARAQVAASFDPGRGHGAGGGGRGRRRQRRAHGRVPAREAGGAAASGRGARPRAHGGLRPRRGRERPRRGAGRPGRGPPAQLHRPAHAALPASAGVFEGGRGRAGAEACGAVVLKGQLSS